MAWCSPRPYAGIEGPGVDMKLSLCQSSGTRKCTCLYLPAVDELELSGRCLYKEDRWRFVATWDAALPWLVPVPVLRPLDNEGFGEAELIAYSHNWEADPLRCDPGRFFKRRPPFLADFEMVDDDDMFPTQEMARDMCEFAVTVVHFCRPKPGSKSFRLLYYLTGTDLRFNDIAGELERAFTPRLPQFVVEFAWSEAWEAGQRLRVQWAVKKAAETSQDELDLSTAQLPDEGRVAMEFLWDIYVAHDSYPAPEQVLEQRCACLSTVDENVWACMPHCRDPSAC